MSYKGNSFKDKAVFASCIFFVIIIFTLIWKFSSSFRTELLMRSVNNTLYAMNDNRHLYASAEMPNKTNVPIGYCYAISGSESLFYVFSIMWEGILVPCGAEISEEGEVSNLTPIGNHARQIFKYIPEEQIMVYTRRFESAYRTENAE